MITMLRMRSSVRVLFANFSGSISIILSNCKQEALGFYLRIVKGAIYLDDHEEPGYRNYHDHREGDIAHKEKSFADSVMFWKKDAAPSAAATSGLDGSSTPVDAAAEKDRISTLTGNQAVVIQRDGKSRIKLPGL